MCTLFFSDCLPARTQGPAPSANRLAPRTGPSRLLRAGLWPTRRAGLACRHATIAQLSVPGLSRCAAGAISQPLLLIRVDVRNCDRRTLARAGERRHSRGCRGHGTTFGPGSGHVAHGTSCAGRLSAPCRGAAAVRSGAGARRVGAVRPSHLLTPINHPPRTVHGGNFSNAERETFETSDFNTRSYSFLSTLLLNSLLRHLSFNFDDGWRIRAETGTHAIRERSLRNEHFRRTSRAPARCPTRGGEPGA